VTWSGELDVAVLTGTALAMYAVVVAMIELGSSQMDASQAEP
jgi:hypothetical protein